MTTFTLTIPENLHFVNDPMDWHSSANDALSISARPFTDWFNDPAGGAPKSNAPVALFTPPDRDFILQARVTVEFLSDFDAGVLFIYADESNWAKLCFEVSPQRQPMIVSVVTRGLSDDCNSVPINGNTVYLRIHRRNSVWAFHYSLDGQLWHFVRYFNLGVEASQVGFSAQCPTGQGCRADFTRIQYRPGTIAHLRSGE